KSFGSKDHSLAINSLDASDRDNVVELKTWPIKGLFMPDAIAAYEVDNKTYLVTANEGDAREYDIYVENIRLGNSGYVLDETVFPNFADLKNNANLGRLNVTKASG
ncbi:choice-of-anchor I domain-containing protein, partial [Nodularia spumigena]|uniref:choice-of-anchor I domain-containing protein n=1 Tax=Nodularia spumigena TaxID=70799 RepID=UPI002B3C1A18|nr:alkaline phosphatase [Nodularia spumigena CH309]